MASLTLAASYSLSSSQTLMVRVPVGVGTLAWRLSVAWRVSIFELPVSTNQLRWLPTGRMAAACGWMDCRACVSPAVRRGLKLRMRSGIWLPVAGAALRLFWAVAVVAAGGVSVRAGMGTLASPLLV